MMQKSIGARLYFFFGVLILMLTGLGSIGFLSLIETSDAIRERVTVSFENAAGVGDLRETARRVNHLLAAAGTSATAADHGHIDALRGEFRARAEAIGARRPSAELEGSLRLFDDMIAAGERYVQAAASQRWVEAGDLALKFQAADAELNKRLDALRNAERENTAATFTAVELDIKKNAVLFAAGVLSCVFLAMWLAVGTKRSLVEPLRALTQATHRIAKEGDLTQEITVDAQGEIGELAAAFRELVRKLREIPANLHGSVQLLHQAVSDLSRATTEHGETLTKQAVALQQTQVTAQEIKQTSVLAAQKADAVLQVVERADEIGRTGEAALDQSLHGLNDIRGSVEEIAQKISLLSERTTQIGGITETVKDLADQSNMLALNAAIEAVRSGEHGKGFAVVAREIRSLADQSVHSTRRVSEILGEISRAIDGAVSITETGERRMEAGIRQIKTSGENMRELSTIVKGNAAAVRQIAAAVSQQNAGIAQIFAAVTDMSKMMDDTLTRLTAATNAATVLQDATEKVSLVVESFRV
jgi:methyl-accepting chemotaxis protein